MHVTPGFSWTDEHISDLRGFVEAGLSASRIAVKLGVSRNAVIGKVHRIGMQLHGFPTGQEQRQQRKTSRPKVSRTSVPPLPAPAEVIHVARVTTPQPARLKIRPGHASQRAKEVQWIEPTEALDLLPDTSEFACTIAELGADMCRWPLGRDAKDMTYCGAECVGTYCARHRAIAYRKVGVIA